tara:strand:- start:725 stop:1414 length:690 start_codon:yes stop_codon:yes gene_type:complete
MKLGLSNTVRSQVSGEFTPADLAGLQFWFRKGIGITESDGSEAEDGDAVYGWADQSGNGKNATGAATRFTYNAASGGVEGTGNNKLNITQIDFTGEFAFYARLKFDTISTGANDILFRDAVSPADDDFFRVQTSTQLRAKIGGGTAMNYSCSTISTGTFYNLGFERDSSDDCRAYLDGTQQDSEINKTPDFNLDRVMGAFDGICVEIVVTNQALSSSNRTNLNNYLNGL